MKEIGNLSGAQLASGIGGSQKLEQTKPENESYTFNDALADKETQADKAEEKEMKKQDIVKRETQEEVNKKEFQKFQERQQLLLGNEKILNPGAANNQMQQKLVLNNNQAKFASMFSAGNQLTNQGQIGLRDLRKLMSERGISFNQLDSNQLVKLSTMHNRGEVTNFLNQLMKKLRNKDKNMFSLGSQIAKDKMDLKDKKVNETEENKKVSDKPDKEMERLREASASDNLDKLQGVPLSHFFETAVHTQFKTGTMMEQQIMEQVMQKMEIKSDQTKSEVAIRLNPEYLGEVNLNMTVDKEKGTVSVNFKTTSRAARDTLKGNLKGLEEAFKAAGLKMEKFEVSLDDELA